MKRTLWTIAIGSGLFVGAVAFGAAQTQTPKSAGGDVTFYKDVLPILQNRCQTCHRPGQIGPMSLLSYEQTRPWARSIKARVATRQMPPWLADPAHGEFANDRSLKQAEIDTIVAWADAGAPSGDAKDSPPPVTFPDNGWVIKPDVVVTLPDYAMPAKGVIDWENFAVPSPFKEDTWVRSIEMQQSVPSVVHHMCVDIVPHRDSTVYGQYEWAEIPKSEDGVALEHDRRATSDVVVVTRKVGASRTDVQRRMGKPTLQAGASGFCWEHGLPATDYGAMGAARLVPAGADLVFSMHYTANGKDVLNRTQLGFTIAKTRPTKKFVQVVIGAGPGPDFAIPPNTPNWKAPTASTVFKRDAQLVWFWPHGHARAKDFTYTLQYPDGRQETVLSVPRYDYNWELQYVTARPVRIPKGTKMVVEAHYDNSSANKNNPNPNVWVYYGQQKWEEMMNGIFGVLVDVDVPDRDIVSARGDLSAG